MEGVRKAPSFFGSEGMSLKRRNSGHNVGLQGLTKGRFLPLAQLLSTS